jgi:hypothetical protein
MQAGDAMHCECAAKRLLDDAACLPFCRRHVPDLKIHLPSTNTNAFIPWGNSNKRELHEKVIWDLLFPGTVLRWLREMGYRW